MCLVSCGKDAKCQPVAYINDDVLSLCYHYHSIGIVIYPRERMSIAKSPITDIQNDAMFEAGDTVHVPRPFWVPPAVGFRGCPASRPRWWR